jgi:hypothetical protein
VCYLQQILTREPINTGLLAIAADKDDVDGSGASGRRRLRCTAAEHAPGDRKQPQCSCWPQGCAGRPHRERFFRFGCALLLSRAGVPRV